MQTSKWLHAFIIKQAQMKVEDLKSFFERSVKILKSITPKKSLSLAAICTGDFFRKRKLHQQIIQPFRIYNYQTIHYRFNEKKLPSTSSYSFQSHYR